MREKKSSTRVEYHIKDIIGQHWERFWEAYEHRIPKDMRSSVAEAVEKMQSCGDPKNGFARYMCLECGQEKTVAFTCKSRFCNRCGKIYIDKWVEKQVETIINVSHRHIVFSIPEELRTYFYRNRDLLKDLSDRAAEVIQYWYRKQSKKKGYQVGIIAVVHTFGRDLKFNPHIHALVTEGALDRDKNWKAVGYIPYEYLRKSWQKMLLDLVKEKAGNDIQAKRLISGLYQRYRDGFYVYAATRMRDARGAAQYIGRYLARPAIAEYRIEQYDGERVRFWYKDHQTGKRTVEELDVLTFIGKLTMHIPKKQFKMVRRYGLYRRDLNKLAQHAVDLHNFIKTKDKKSILPKRQRRQSWKERMIESFGINPLRCPECGKEMELWRIWHPKYGDIYDIKLDRKEVATNGETLDRGRDTISRGQSIGVLQLSMSEMRVLRSGGGLHSG